MPVPCLIYEQLDVCCVGEAENWKRKTDCRGTDLWAHHKTINKTETRATKISAARLVDCGLCYISQRFIISQELELGMGIKNGEWVESAAFLINHTRFLLIFIS